MTTNVVAEPAAASPRAARPHAVSGGLAFMGGEPVLFIAAQGVRDLDARFSALADVAYHPGGDRIFGPRLLARAGMRAYLHDGASNPFVALGGVVYHEFHVDYDSSDASQQASTALGAAVTVGHELVTASQLTWVVEATAMQLESVQGRMSAPEGFAWQAGTMVGARF